MRNETWFYVRREDDKEIEIIWKPFATYSVMTLILGYLVFIVMANIGMEDTSMVYFSVLSFCLLVILIIWVLVSFFVCRKVRKEIKEASKTMKMDVEGNRLSFQNPLKITLYKENQ